MFRLLLWVGLGYLIYRMLSPRRPAGYRRDRVQPGRGESGNAGTGEKMVKCSVCGLYVPESEAESAAGRFFCSRECREKGRRRG